MAHSYNKLLETLLNRSMPKFDEKVNGYLSQGVGIQPHETMLNEEKETSESHLISREGNGHKQIIED